MSAGAGRLMHAIKALRERWDVAREQWDDKVAQEFEKNHLLPLEQQAEAAVHGMDTINEVLMRVRRDCS